MKTIARRSFCAAAAAAALLPFAARAQDIKERTIKFSFTSQKDHPQTLGAEKFAELVSQKSGKKLAVKIFGGGVLGGDLQNVSAVQGGTTMYQSASRTQRPSCAAQPISGSA